MLAKRDAFLLISKGFKLTMFFANLVLVLRCFIKLNSMEVQFNPLKPNSRSQYGYARASILQCFVLNTSA